MPTKEISQFLLKLCLEYCRLFFPDTVYGILKWSPDEWPQPSLSWGFTGYVIHTFRQHSTRIAAKIECRNKIITAKLAGMTWDDTCQCSNTSVSSGRTVALSRACCVPAYGRSSYVKLIDWQLIERNYVHCSYFLARTIRSTPLQWFPALSHCSSGHQTHWHCRLFVTSKPNHTCLFILIYSVWSIDSFFGERIMERNMGGFQPYNYNTASDSAREWLRRVNCIR